MFLDNNLLVNKDKLKGIEEDITCPICQGILNDPYFCNKCQNNFCNNCITKYKKNNFICPFRCQDPQYISNRFLKKIFNELLKFKCPKGCDEIIPYKDVETHNEKCLKEDFKEKYLESATQIEILKVQIENYKDIENELDNIKERNNELEYQIDELREQKDAIEEEIEQILRDKYDLEYLEYQIEEIRDRNNCLEQEIEDEKQNQFDLQNENNNLKKEVEELIEKNKEINEQLKKMNIENEQYKNKIEITDNKMIEYENIIKILNEEKNSLNKEILSMKKNIKIEKNQSEKISE